MVVVEAVDELLAVDVALVLRPRVPQGDVRVDDEVALAVLAVHGGPPDWPRVMAVSRPGSEIRTPRASSPSGSAVSQSETPARGPHSVTWVTVAATRDHSPVGAGRLPMSASTLLQRPASADPRGPAGRAPAGCSRRGSAARTTASRWRRVEPVFSGTDGGVESLFFQCGNEVLTGLHRTLAGEPVSLMLTDAGRSWCSTGSAGDRQLLRALDDVHLAPGFAYAERDGRHQRSRASRWRTGRPTAGPRRRALRAQPLHVHVRRRAGARPGHAAGSRAAST